MTTSIREVGIAIVLDMVHDSKREREVARYGKWLMFDDMPGENLSSNISVSPN